MPILVLMLLTISAQAAEVIDVPDPSNPDMYAAVQRLKIWTNYLFGPIGDFVLGVAFLIAVGAWVVAPQGFVAIVQRVIYILMIAALPTVVPILVSVAR